MNDFEVGDYVRAVGFKGIALYIIGKSQIEIDDSFCDHSSSIYATYCPYCNGDEYLPTIECDDIYDCVMVGDDKVYRIDKEDLCLIDEDEFCGSCGQIGCGHGR